MERELQTLRAELASVRRELRRRRRAPGLAVALVALAVALVPAGLFAANPFDDLNAGSPHNGNIDAIYSAGITTGCVPNASYCPNDFVTRQEMASFLARTAGLGPNPPVANAATAQTATNAINATNATNAVSAQTATNATNATNAATLGGVPASAYLQGGGALDFWYDFQGAVGSSGNLLFAQDPPSPIAPSRGPAAA